MQGARLLLEYHFDPNGARDGITATVPLSVLLALSDAEIDWLVPGLREDKAAALIKSLPKALRRACGAGAGLRARLSGGDPTPLGTLCVGTGRVPESGRRH